MTPEQFVAALQVVVIDGSASGEMASLKSPPGRSPWPSSVRRSEWFNSLSAHDQSMVGEVVRAAAFAATFAVCCILDEVTAFDDAGGSLVLTYISPDGHQVRLNRPEICELHAELRGDGPPP